MTTANLKEIVIPSEEAIFWMDRWGNWCNRHGRFEHKKIIAYFHSAIGRDEKGYYVSQVNGDVSEKVYFRYEDTALFVFDFVVADPPLLVLNTGRRLPLDPTALSMRRDALYVHEGDERIKFDQTSLLKISRYFEYEGERCFLRMQGRRFPIAAEEEAVACGETWEQQRSHGDLASEKSCGSPNGPLKDDGSNP